MSLDRRTFLSTSLGMLAVPAAGLAMSAPAHAASTSSPTALDPILLLRKLKLRSDDGLMFWWLQGPKIGQVGATLTPLYTSSVGTIQRVRLLEDGGLELTQLEMLFMLDLETGDALEEWRNPYTGEVTGWQRWMSMGDRPGNLTSRMVGRKCRDYADLPEAFRARLSEVAPRIADDPIGAIDRPAGRFER